MQTYAPPHLPVKSGRVRSVTPVWAGGLSGVCLGEEGGWLGNALRADRERAEVRQPDVGESTSGSERCPNLARLFRNERRREDGEARDGTHESREHHVQIGVALFFRELPGR